MAEIGKRNGFIFGGLTMEKIVALKDLPLNLLWASD